MPDDDDLSLMVAVAEEAGELSLHWLEKGAKSWDKKPGDPVTEADLALNDLIERRLKAARPGYGWLSEETRDDPANRAQTCTFVVDPIDGTRAFVRSEPTFTVSIGLVREGASIAGVVHNPMTRETYAAVRGGGATLNGNPVRASSRDAVAGCRMLGRADAFRSRLTGPWPRMELPPKVPNSIAYRLCLVAEGRWDGVVSFHGLSDWDIAAGVLVLEEAGGVATNLEGAAFTFNAASTRQNGLVAAGEKLHPLLLPHIRPAT